MWGEDDTALGMTPSLLMERFREHCRRSRVCRKTVSLFHLGLASRGPSGAFRRAVQAPEVA